jgi:hypothetical protein
MAEGNFPRAYQNTVGKEGTESMMEYVPFDNLSIGARKSAMPKGGANNIKSLSHVGGNAGGSAAKGVNHS